MSSRWYHRHYICVRCLWRTTRRQGGKPTPCKPLLCLRKALLPRPPRRRGVRASGSETTVQFPIVPKKKYLPVSPWPRCQQHAISHPCPGCRRGPSFVKGCCVLCRKLKLSDSGLFPWRLRVVSGERLGAGGSRLGSCFRASASAWRSAKAASSTSRAKGRAGGRPVPE